MTSVDCKVNLPADLGEQKALTVGTIFQIQCEGMWPQLAADQIRIQIPEDQKYILKVLKAEFVSADVLSLEVTSYMAGDFQFPELVLTDGKETVHLKKIQYTVASVLDPQQPQQEPYGPMGPASLALPIWYYLVFAGILGLVVFAILGRIWIFKRRRDLLEELKAYDSPLSPMAQLSKDLRIYTREYPFLSGGEAPGEVVTEFVHKLDQSFRVYLIRELRIPALDLKDKALLKAISKSHKKVWEGAGARIQDLIHELHKALLDSTKVKVRDARQLWTATQEVAEAISSSQAKGKKS